MSEAKVSPQGAWLRITNRWTIFARAHEAGCLLRLWLNSCLPLNDHTHQKDHTDHDEQDWEEWQFDLSSLEREEQFRRAQDERNHAERNRKPVRRNLIVSSSSPSAGGTGQPDTSR